MSYTPKSGFLLDKPVKRRAPKSDFLRSLARANAAPGTPQGPGMSEEQTYSHWRLVDTDVTEDEEEDLEVAMFEVECVDTKETFIVTLACEPGTKVKQWVGALRVVEHTLIKAAGGEGLPDTSSVPTKLH